MRRLAVLASVVLTSCSTPEPRAEVTPVLVPNLRKVGAKLYSSGEPEGEEAFRQLAALGIKTVISVDGEKPDVAAARRHGLRYVHLPFMYSGIPASRALELAKAARDLPGPVLIHCHHGKHRSPAAAAVARLALEGGTNDEAVAELRAAGADPHYKGLYRSVAEFKRPTRAELDAVTCSFPEVAPPEPFVDAMVEIDHRLERLQRGQPHEGDFGHEALLLREGLVELGRIPGDRGPAFEELLRGSVAAAVALEEEARNGPPSRGALDRVKRSCVDCHERYRDR